MASSAALEGFARSYDSGIDRHQSRSAVTLHPHGGHVRRTPLIFSKVLFIAVLAFTSHLALAQSDASSLSGAITDSSGAVVANAKVTLHDNATGSERVVLTTESGSFTLPNVQPGLYTVR